MFIRYNDTLINLAYVMKAVERNGGVSVTIQRANGDLFSINLDGVAIDDFHNAVRQAHSFGVGVIEPKGN